MLLEFLFGNPVQLLGGKPTQRLPAEIEEAFAGLDGRAVIDGRTRVVRSDVMAAKQQDYVLAAHSLGTPNRRVITRHILPNVMSVVMVALALGVALAILTESALSFLGLGFPADFPTWGRLLFDAKDYLQQAPLRVIAPGFMIAITVIAVNFIGDGIRDALDPKLRSK